MLTVFVSYLLCVVLTAHGGPNPLHPLFDILHNTGIYTASEALKEPISVYSRSGQLSVDLVVEEYRFSTDVFSFSTRVFCWTGMQQQYCSFPGPTLHCFPGDVVTISLTNNLKKSPEEHTLFNSNNTNIYLHGLQIDIGHTGYFHVTSGGGDKIEFAVTIPLDQAPGIQWYHSVIPGFEALHVMGGLHGAFVVETLAEYLPVELAEMSRNMLVFSHVKLEDDLPIDTTSTSNYSLSWSLTRLAQASGSAIDISPQYYPVYLEQAVAPPVDYFNTSIANFTDIEGFYNGGNVSIVRDAWLVNGQYQPKLVLHPGEWRILDLVVASGDRMLEIEIRTQVGFDMGSKACETVLLALDGIYLPEPRTGPYVDHLPLLQGSRASIAIMCPSVGIFYLQSACVPDNGAIDISPFVRIGEPQTKSTQNLVSLVVEGLPNTVWYPPKPSSLSRIPRPAYLDSLLDEILPPAPTTASNPSWSIGLENAGCCDFDSSYSHSDKVSLTTAASSTSTLPGTGTGTGIGGSQPAQFWMGVGRDCVLSCYDDVQCSMLFGPDFSVLQTPAVNAHTCSYGPFSDPNYGNAPPLLPSNLTSMIGYSAAAPGAALLMAIATNSSPPQPHPNYRRQSLVNRVEEISFWARAPFPKPMRLFSQLVQVASYDSKGQSGYTFGPLRGIGANDHAFYGEPGDWRDTLPGVVGELIVRSRFRTAGVKLLGSSLLKYSDAGMLATFEVLLGVPNATVTNPVLDTNNTSPTGLPTAPTPATPWQLSPALKGCDAHGVNWYYSETLDFQRQLRIVTTNSCPNHFSVCQEETCGGPDVTYALPTVTSFELPLNPIFSSAPADSTCVQETVAVALNGVSIVGVSDGSTRICSTPGPANMSIGGRLGAYGQATSGRSSCSLEGDRDGALYCGDILKTKEVVSYDKCGGFTDKLGRYSYKVTPICLLQQLQPSIVSDHVYVNIGSSSLLAGVNTSAYNMTVALDGVNTTTADPLHSITRGTDNRTAPHSCTDDTCLFSAAEQVGYSSVQVGWALDGFPLYGPYGPKGTLMLPCSAAGANPSMCLDKCNGYYGALPEMDQFLYRYFTTGPLATGACSSYIQNAGPCNRVHGKCCLSAVPAPTFWPYTVGCFRGCRLNDALCKPTGERGTTEYYIPSVSQYPNTVYLGSALPDYNPAPVPPSMNISGVTSEPAPMTAAKKAEMAYKKQQQRILAGKRATGGVSSARPPQMGASRMAVRLPTNRSIAVVSFVPPPFDPLAAQQGIGPGVGTVAIEELPVSAADPLITGIVRDPATSLLFFVTPSGLYSIPDQGGEPTHIIGGLLSISIRGYDLGNSIEDIISLTVQDYVCTSIVVMNSSFVTCLITSPSLVGVSVVRPVTAYDVSITTAGGTAVGPYLQPQVWLAEGSGRPVIATVEIVELPFVPQAIALSPNSPNTKKIDATEAGGYTLGRMPTSDTILYITNVGLAGYNIFRCRADGTQVEPVADQVQRGLGIAVVATDAPDTLSVIDNDVLKVDAIFFSDASKGTVSRIIMPSLIPGEVLGAVALQGEIGQPGYGLHPTILMRSLQLPTAVVADASAGFLWVSTFAGGSILQANLQAALTHNISTASTQLNLLNETDSYFEKNERIDGVAWESGDTSTTGDASTTNLTFSSSTMTSSTAQDSLPSVALRLGASKSRFLGACFAPAIPTSDAVPQEILHSVAPLSAQQGVLANATEPATWGPSPAYSWQQQRIFAMDPNQGAIFTVSSSGFPTTTVDVGSGFGSQSLVWPLTCTTRPTVIIQQADMPISDQQYTATVYVAEFLGRIWELTFPLDDSGVVLPLQIPTPKLLMDASRFPASTRLRELLSETSSSASGDTSMSIFFEITG